MTSLKVIFSHDRLVSFIEDRLWSYFMSGHLVTTIFIAVYRHDRTWSFLSLSLWVDFYNIRINSQISQFMVTDGAGLML